MATHYEWCSGEDTNTNEPCTTEWEGVTTDDGHALIRVGAWSAGGKFADISVYGKDGEAVIRLDESQFRTFTDAAIDSDPDLYD